MLQCVLWKGCATADEPRLARFLRENTLVTGSFSDPRTGGRSGLVLHKGPFACNVGVSCRSAA